MDTSTGGAKSPTNPTRDRRRIPWGRAERILGRRLDRRRAYASVRDPFSHRSAVCALLVFSNCCSGCCEGYEYGCDGVRGAGCAECGHTGRRRWRQWIPLPQDAAGKPCAAA